MPSLRNTGPCLFSSGGGREVQYYYVPKERHQIIGGTVPMTTTCD